MKKEHRSMGVTLEGTPGGDRIGWVARCSCYAMSPLCGTRVQAKSWAEEHRRSAGVR